MPATKNLGDFALDVLDSLEAQVAVIDVKGEVVAANGAWKRFAAGSDDEHAITLRDGLREVLAGRRKGFAAEYPADAADAAEAGGWFRTAITRFEHRGARYFAAVREDVTGRRRIEDQLACATCAAREVNRELRDLLASERMKARTDELTGLDNRRQFFERARPMFAAALRYGTPLALVMLDIDHFKRVNDALGHQAGDVILRKVADITREAIRGSDVLARYGGEEFVVALPGVDAQEAFAASEKVRELIASRLDITVSGGVSQAGGAGDTLEALIARADRALYDAKNGGRNRTCVAEAPKRDMELERR